MDTGRHRPAWASWAFLGVLLLALMLRVYHLSGNPPELIPDELDLYNSMQSYVQSGHDIDGGRGLLLASEAHFPKMPMYALAEYASSLAFGNGPFGLRYPAAIFGVLAVALVYGIGFELTRRRDVALAAAFFMTTQPLFVHLSRIAWEPSSELPFVLGGVYWLLRGIASNDDRVAGRSGTRSLALGAALLGLAAYTYPAGWFYALVIGGGLLASNLAAVVSREKLAVYAAACALWLAVAGPVLWLFVTEPMANARFSSIATFAGGVTPATIAQFLHNYFAHFTWSFLVATGDPLPGRTWRYLAGFGAFYWWLVLLAVAGCASWNRVVRKPWMWTWLVVWLVVYPLGGALTNEGAPNAPRALAGAPIFCIFAALATGWIIDGLRGIRSVLWRRRATGGAAVVALALSFFSLAHFERTYLNDFPGIYPNAWDSGARSTFAVLRSEIPHYRRLCFDVRPAWLSGPSYFRYYLSDRPIPTEQPRVRSAPDCFQPGTLYVADVPMNRPGFEPIAAALERKGGTFSVIYGRTGP